MSYLNWDFRYITEQERRRHEGRVTQGQLMSTVRGDDRRFRRRRIGPWLCLLVMVLCLWMLYEIFIRGGI